MRFRVLVEALCDSDDLNARLTYRAKPRATSSGWFGEGEGSSSRHSPLASGSNVTVVCLSNGGGW
jgi:hypothetical protein